MGLGVVCALGSQDGGVGPERAWELELGEARGMVGGPGFVALVRRARVGLVLLWVLGRGLPQPRLRQAPLTLLTPLQLQLEKHKGEILGVVVVESGWGSILPTVILANMMNGGPAARSGKLSIGDQIMSINGTSLVGLPLATCQGIIKVGTGPLALFLMLCNPH